MGTSKTSRIKRLLKRGIERGLKVVSPKTAEPRPPDEVMVTFEDAGGAELARLTVDGGQTVLFAARRAGLDLDHFCGGQCSCGTCKVVVLSDGDNLTRAAGNEQVVLGQSALTSGSRLACQARVMGDVRVQIPRWF